MYREGSMLQKHLFFLFSITLKSFYEEKKKKDSHSVFQAPYCSHLRIPHGRIQQRAQTVLKLCIKCNTASRVERVIGGHHYIHLIVVLAASAWVTHVKKIDVTDKQSMYELSTKGFSMNELKNSGSRLARRTLLQYPHHSIYTASDGILILLMKKSAAADPVVG